MTNLADGNSRLAMYGAGFCRVILLLDNETQLLMRFIEMTGKTLLCVVTEHDLSPEEVRAAGVTDECIVRVNEQGDIEVRRPDRWDIVGGLLGNYRDRLRSVTGKEYV